MERECVKENPNKMPLTIRDFANSDAGSENVSRGIAEDNSDEEISNGPHVPHNVKKKEN